MLCNLNVLCMLSFIFIFDYFVQFICVLESHSKYLIVVVRPHNFVNFGLFLFFLHKIILIQGGKNLILIKDTIIN